MNMRNLLAASLLCGIVLTLSAQQTVAPPPKPVNDAPANVAVLKLLQVGMPESVVLDKIHAITDKFDTSIDALVVLKQAGATEAELKAIMAQGAAPADTQPAATPADTGPSLAESMQFIQDKLNNLGKVAFVEFMQDVNTGPVGTFTLTNEISNLVGDQNQCRISYHRKMTFNGKTTLDNNDGFSLRDVQDIVVKPWEQYQNEIFARNGTPNYTITSSNPPIILLQVRRPHGEENVVLFADADLADRVARAMQHAVELCGGGNKDKF
ncbi:MAG: hypothetical protein ABR990_13345 [Terracidiphilus sp.]|jgi:hypothetical protein